MPAQPTGSSTSALVRRGVRLEIATLAWNVIGVVILAYAAILARSIALAGFGLDSLIEIGASTVVLWELADVESSRQHRAMRLIGIAFVALSLYLALQSTFALTVEFRPHHSDVGIIWTGATAAVMFALARAKSMTGSRLANPVLITEGRVTLIDAVLAVAVLTGLILNALAGWWWADPGAGYVILFYAIKEARGSLRH